MDRSTGPSRPQLPGEASTKARHPGSGRIGFRPLIKLALQAVLILSVFELSACGNGPSQDAPENAASQQAVEAAGVPLVTMKHWRDSTSGERYSFLIGFVTMLELEKEWQGRDDGEILPFDKSLVASWVAGFAHRPLFEIYNELNKHLADHPGELERQVAEVMWFIFVQPRLEANPAGGASNLDEAAGQ